MKHRDKFAKKRGGLPPQAHQEHGEILASGEGVLMERDQVQKMAYQELGENP